MLKEALKYIVGLSVPHTFDIGDSCYTDKPLSRIPASLLASPLNVHTLTGVLDYLQQETDRGSMRGERFIIHVIDYNHVRLTRELNADRAREVLLEVEDSTRKFPFGTYMSTEDFIVGIQSHFVQDEMTETILRLLSNIVDSNSITQSDDGMTQSVTAKTGIVTRGAVDVPNPVILRPLCTFSEIKQPERRLLLRLRSGCRDGEGVQAALFEADGNAWKSSAILTIRDYFISELYADDTAIAAGSIIILA